MYAIKENKTYVFDIFMNLEHLFYVRPSMKSLQAKLKK